MFSANVFEKKLITYIPHLVLRKLHSPLQSWEIFCRRHGIASIFLPQCPGHLWSLWVAVWAWASIDRHLSSGRGSKFIDNGWYIYRNEICLRFHGRETHEIIQIRGTYLTSLKLIWIRKGCVQSIELCSSSSKHAGASSCWRSMFHEEYRDFCLLLELEPAHPMSLMSRFQAASKPYN